MLRVWARRLPEVTQSERYTFGSTFARDSAQYMIVFSATNDASTVNQGVCRTCSGSSVVSVVSVVGSVMSVRQHRGTVAEPGDVLPARRPAQGDVESAL